MPVWIDNITTTQTTYPNRAEISLVCPNTDQYYASITISLEDFIGINERIIKRLEEFKKLTNNWDDDDALAPTIGCINQAKYLAKLLEKRGQSIYHSSPGPNGEIMLDIRNSSKTRSIEIIFYPTRSVFVKLPEEGRATQGTFLFEELPDHLHWLNQQ